MRYIDLRFTYLLIPVLFSRYSELFVRNRYYFYPAYIWRLVWVTQLEFHHDL